MTERNPDKYPNPTTTWLEQIIVHLELLNQIVAKFPANEKLEPVLMNKVLDLHRDFHTVFLLQMSLQGFKPEKTKEL